MDLILFSDIFAGTIVFYFSKYTEQNLHPLAQRQSDAEKLWKLSEEWTRIKENNVKQTEGTQEKEKDGKQEEEKQDGTQEEEQKDGTQEEEEVESA